jgi:hypothetical protein
VRIARAAKRRPSRRIQIGPWSVKPWSKRVWANVLSLLAAFLALPELQARGIDPRDIVIAQAAINLVLNFVSREHVVERRPRR